MISNITPMFCFILLCLLFLYYLKWIRHYNKYFARIPGFKPWFPLGNLNLFWSNKRANYLSRISYALQAMTGISKLFQNEGMYYLQLGFRDLVVLTSPEKAKGLLKNKEELKKSSVYDTLKMVVGDSLFTSSGDPHWKRLRRTINPWFRGLPLKKCQEIMDIHCSILIDKLNKLEYLDSVNISSLLTLINFDIVSVSLLGTRLNAIEDPDRLDPQYAERVFNLSMDRVLSPILQPDVIFYNHPKGLEFLRLRQLTKTSFQKHFMKRKELYMNQSNDANSIDQTWCFSDLFIHHQQTEADTFTDEEAINELITLLVAGFETTSVGIGWVLFLVGHHPDVQSKIQTELDEVFGDGEKPEWTEEKYRKLKYLNCVIKESQRLYSPVPIIARQLKKDFLIDDITLPKGTHVAVLISSIHRNEKVYKNPDVFNPERFLPENNVYRDPCAFIPFSYGERNCIAASFAEKSTKTVLSNVLLNFEIKSLVPVDKISVKWNSIGAPQVPIHIKMKKRTNF